MKNGIVCNLLFAFLVFGIFSVSANGDAGSSSTAVEPQDGEKELRMRENKEVREVNEGAAAEIEKIKAARRTRYIDEELGYVPDVNLVTSEELAAIEKEREQREKAIRARFGDSGAKEQPQPVQQKERPSGAERADVRPAMPVPAARGTVTGIVLYNNKGAALIAGEIVRENDTVMGVKVTKINRDNVEFEKQGRKWIQEVGQAPQPGMWEEPSKAEKKASPAQPSAGPAKAKPGR
jgi:hypothetical protein